MARTGRPLTFDKKTIRQIRALASKGVRVVEIAEIIGRLAGSIYSLMTRLNIPRQPRNKFLKGEKNVAWNGGRWLDDDGYVMIHCPNHPHKTYGCYVREHRLVMEKHIGRYLTAKEVVHHIDGNRQNNDIQNLQLFEKNSDHLRHELAGRVPKWTEDGKRRIREGSRRKRKNRQSSTQKKLESDASP